MSSYTANIPQPSDDPSESQDQILQNFQSLNTLYGSSGDHFPWTNTAAGIISRHAKVTLPRLPTAGSPPGDVVPTPAANEGVMYARVVDSQTFPTWRKDNNTLDWPMIPLKSFGIFTIPGAVLGNSFNVASVVRTSTGVYQITFTESLTADYCVLVTCAQTTSAGIARVASFQNRLTTGFTFHVLNANTLVPADGFATRGCFAVLHS